MKEPCFHKNDEAAPPMLRHANNDLYPGYLSVKLFLQDIPSGEAFHCSQGKNIFPGSLLWTMEEFLILRRIFLFHTLPHRDGHDYSGRGLPGIFHTRAVLFHPAICNE